MLTIMPFVFKREFRRILVNFALGLSVCLVQANGASTNNGSCTVTTTCSITTPMQDNKDCKVIAQKLQQLDTKINAILDQLMAYSNITDLYPLSSLLHSCEEIKSNWPVVLLTITS